MSKTENRSWGDIKIPVKVWWPHLAAIIHFVMPPDVQAEMVAFLNGDDCMVAEKRIAFERVLIESHARLALALEPLKDPSVRMSTRSMIDNATSIGLCLGHAEMAPPQPIETSLPAAVRDHVEFVRDYVTPQKDKAEIDRFRSSSRTLSRRQSERCESIAGRIESRAADVAFAIGEPLKYVAHAALDRYLRAIVEKQSADSV